MSQPVDSGDYTYDVPQRKCLDCLRHEFERDLVDQTLRQKEHELKRLREALRASERKVEQLEHRLLDADVLLP